MVDSQNTLQNLSQRRILIVDDDANLAGLLKEALEKNGFLTAVALMPQEGLALFDSFKPHLVFLDYVLPNMLGVQVLEEMRKSPQAKEAIFILMSGIMKSQAVMTEAKIKYGATDFLIKPFRIAQIIELVLRNLRDRSLEKPAAAEETEATAKPGFEYEKGNLKNYDLAFLLGRIYLEHLTGTFQVIKENTVKAIYLEKGQPVFAVSNNSQDYLGSLIVAKGLLPKNTIDTLLKDQPPTVRLGDLLIQKGLIAGNVLFSLIEEQVCKIIYSVFSWEIGSYKFIVDEMVSKESVKIRMEPAKLLLQGLRNHYKKERLENLLGGSKTVYQKNSKSALPPQATGLLSGPGLQLFEGINGQNSILDLISSHSFSILEMLSLLYCFCCLGLIEKRPQ